MSCTWRRARSRWARPPRSSPPSGCPRSTPLRWRWSGTAAAGCSWSASRRRQATRMVDAALHLTIANPTPSWNPFDDLAMLFHYDFMIHAFQAGTIVAIVAGSIGYFVVLRGSAFAAHALSHIGFAGAAGAIVAGLSPGVGLLAFTLGGGAAIGALGNRLRGRDVTIGIVLAWTLGLGRRALSVRGGDRRATGAPVHLAGIERLLFPAAPGQLLHPVAGLRHLPGNSPFGTGPARSQLRFFGDVAAGRNRFAADRRRGVGFQLPAPDPRRRCHTSSPSD